MEFMPRITRAQVMDILSSQANLAGYQAVIDAAGAFDRAMPMMMTAGRYGPAGQGVRHGRRRCGPAGHRHRAPPRRCGDRHRRARRGRRAGGIAGRQVHHDRGAQGRLGFGRLCPRADQGRAGGAGRAGRRAHREAGYRHHDRADPGPAGAEAGEPRDGRVHGAGLGDRRSRRRARRQCRADPAGQRDHDAERGDHHRATPTSPGASRLRRASSMRATCSPSSRR